MLKYYHLSSIAIRHKKYAINKTQKMCVQAVSENPFVLKYCLERYKTQEVGDKAVDSFLPTLTFFLIGLLQI